MSLVLAKRPSDPPAMPVYVYEAVREDGGGVETFEFRQKMSDPPLTHHPETGVAIQRIMATPNLSGMASGTDASERERPIGCGGGGAGACGMGGCAFSKMGN